MVCCCSLDASFPGRRFDGRLVHGDIAIAALLKLLGFGCDLRDVEHEFLLPVGSRYGDSSFGGGVERSEDFLGPVLVVERRSVDRRDEIAGAQYTGQWQERVHDLIAASRRKRPILAMGDPIGIVDAGRWSKSDNNVSRYLRPFMESGELTVMCECTTEQLAAVQRKEPSFVDTSQRRAR